MPEPVDHQDFVDDHCRNIKAQKQESSENGSGTVKLEAVVKVEEVSFDERIAAEFYNENNIYPEKKLTEVPLISYSVVELIVGASSNSRRLTESHSAVGTCFQIAHGFWE
ncbi:putative parathyroid hormone 2 receptor [Trichinella spiralis]|uniref:putative parathyroid hormone 2 receptor n=1 Tax=Trichinella spiralis TaxID=6334 RepID=UPI0001EFCA24|nr:putative parathyroid hormone 2 receptor [Trichinella spiralis]